MFSIDFNNVPATYELSELVRMFLPPDAYRILLPGESPVSGDILVRIPDETESRDDGKRYLYNELNRLTGKSLPWGTLTGVRPVKLVSDLLRKGNKPDQVRETLINDYYLSKEKAELIIEIRERQEPFLQNKDEKAVALYVGIPFCPTRCLYCSFPSYVGSEEKISAYLKALYKEIEAVALLMNDGNYYPQSIYIGGGTPTSLDAGELRELLEKIKKSFRLNGLEEFTLEAGRPDTITREKLLEIKDKGVDRISINPQTTKEETLALIGRHHTNAELFKAFDMAKSMGFKAINADLIAGLPEETADDFKKSLKDIVALGPDNITVHTLAVKRASRLWENDPMYNYSHGKVCHEMVAISEKVLADSGYEPYYLYRQKQMMDNLENVGYSIPGKESLYNIRIMEEDQTIIALGAGGISKIYHREENRLERIPNVSNYEIYIEKIVEMIDRKRKGIGRII